MTKSVIEQLSKEELHYEVLCTLIREHKLYEHETEITLRITGLYNKANKHYKTKCKGCDIEKCDFFKLEDDYFSIDDTLHMWDMDYNCFSEVMNVALYDNLTLIKALIENKEYIEEDEDEEIKQNTAFYGDFPRGE